MSEIKEWEKPLSRSETNKEYIVVQDTDGGSQASYQLPKSMKDYLVENRIIVEKKNNDSSKHYALRDDYILQLSENIQNLIGGFENPNVIFIEKKDGKLDIRKRLNSDGAYSWFKKLYDKSVQGDIFKARLLDDEKVLFFDLVQKYNVNFSNLDLPMQIIYFGAPGTGKSFQLNNDAQPFQNNLRRITFHPNILYGDFVGTFKPFPTEDSRTPITYRYVPGILIKTLFDAFLNPGKPQLLVIEEINRANVSAVFGDMFQLLDRNEIGESTYAIDISEDLQLYIQEEIFEKYKGNEDLLKEIKEKLKDGLRFPDNFYIWATMNSADQGVTPLDTAFKRRWDFKYFGIDEAYDEAIFNGFSKINLGSNKEVSWNDMRQFLNDRLSFLNIPEDKLLGPYFLSKKMLSESKDEVTKAFKSKVLMYLFEDIGMHNRSKLFNVKVLRYSNIIDEFDKRGEDIFVSSEELKKYINVVDSNPLDNQEDENIDN